MSELILRAVPRTVVGKKVKQLRREGLVPGVVYGPVMDGTVQVSVERRVLERFYMAHGHSTLFTLKWDGGQQPVFIREVQEDPVKRVPIHVDFFAPNLRKELTAMVPVVLHQVPGDAEGILTHARNEVEVRGMPADLPQQVEADASHLHAVGDTVRAGDLPLPAGVTLVSDPDEVIALLAAEAAPVEEEPTPSVLAGEAAAVETTMTELEQTEAAVEPVPEG
jgi:large subunit ribosomal protein L25